MTALKLKISQEEPKRLRYSLEYNQSSEMKADSLVIERLEVNTR